MAAVVTTCRGTDVLNGLNGGNELRKSKFFSGDATAQKAKDSFASLCRSDCCVTKEDDDDILRIIICPRTKNKPKIVRVPAAVD